jgi:uncharacterized membrane protein YkoI
MRSLKMKYLLPAVMACAVFAGGPTDANAKFLFFGGDDANVRPVVSREEAQTLARGVLPGQIESTRVIKDGDQTAYIIDVDYHGRTHTVTVDGETGQVVADRVGRGTMFPMSLFE